MSTQLSALLQPLLQQPTLRILWLTDENIGHAPCAAQPNVTVIGNRLDTIERLQASGWQASFNDFELSELPANSFDRIIYRVSKEKAVVHYLINESKTLLREGGELVLIGEKNDGIRTYSRKAEQYLNGEKLEEKHGDMWVAHLTCNLEAEERLPDQEYEELRLLDVDNHSFYSKPCLFGWNKVDKGSRFLVENLAAMLGGSGGHKAKHALDLGCGYGYLSQFADQYAEQITATDNNAAAIKASLRNLNTASATVVASNAGDTLTANSFDLILCNPPFHAGFDIEGDLTDLFLRAVARLLTPEGVACFVVNQHIPLERKAQSLFAQVNTHADNGHFKLVKLQYPK